MKRIWLFLLLSAFSCALIAQTKAQPSKPTGYENGHGWVDLGLSVKWATCNVGAKNPSDYGGYYAWGEKRPKSRYDWDNCFDCLDDKGDNWAVYKAGFLPQITLASGHDTARNNWGGRWRMPTDAENEELCKKCKWTWTSRGGHRGYVVTGPNGNSIVLPAAGCRDGSDSCDVGKTGRYWSNTLNSSYSSRAHLLGFEIDSHGTCSDPRFNGRSVRPVTE